MHAHFRARPRARARTHTHTHNAHNRLAILHRSKPAASSASPPPPKPPPARPARSAPPAARPAPRARRAPRLPAARASCAAKRPTPTSGARPRARLAPRRRPPTLQTRQSGPPAGDERTSHDPAPRRGPRVRAPPRTNTRACGTSANGARAPVRPGFDWRLLRHCSCASCCEVVSNSTGPRQGLQTIE